MADLIHNQNAFAATPRALLLYFRAMKRLHRLLIILLSSSLLAQTPAPQPPQATILKAARVLDVKAGKYLDGQAVLVRAGSIEAVGPFTDLKAQAPTATVIDLGAATLLPGLIDCHTHLLENYDAKLGGDDPNMAITVSTMSTASRALLGAKMGKEDVEAGITTVRDVGNSGWNGDVALRDAIRAGWVEGPRMAVSTRALSAAGGQFGDLQRAAQELVAQEYAVVGNPNAARDAVQQAFYDGADLIKVIVNTGPRVIAPDTLKAVVEEAHRVHRKVAAHAIGDDATRIAADAGVDSIEHGYTIPDDALKTMAAKHIYLVPTDYPTEGYLAVYKNSAGVTPERLKQMEAGFAGFAHSNQERLRRAVAAGVPIAFGSDEYYDTPGFTRGQASLKPLESYALSGMTPLQIIQAATINAAELIGVAHLGSLEKGKGADVIAVVGDPLKDITVLEKVQFVMLKGKVVRNDLSH
ncbi:MAG: amidohydrolase family protein [Acidobacteriia bacterium]|nr:amidohydrolase family protein [Terriglobia bacterium]